MIESNIIKRFLIKTFMKNSRLDIAEVARTALSILSTKFFVNESVKLNETGALGKVVRCEKSTYVVDTQEGSEIEARFEDMQRKNAVCYEDILYFLDCATTKTPFGRILIENALERIAEIGYCPPPPAYGQLGRYRDEGCELGGTEAYPAYEEPKRGRRGRGPGTAPGTRGTDGQAKEDNGMVDMSPMKKTGQGRKGPQSKKSNYDDPVDKLDLGRLKQLVVEHFEEETLKKLIKAYVFLRNFAPDFAFGDFTLQELAGAIVTADYSSQLICTIHSALINTLDSEIKAREDKYYESIRFVIDALEPYETDTPIQTLKKRASINPDNWKQQTKAFLQNLSKNLEDDKVLRLCDFAKKDNARGRLDLITFLIDITILTDIFHGLVNAKQSFLKAERIKYDELCALRRKKAETAQYKIEKLASELSGHMAMVLNHPLKVPLGKYKGYIIFIMDKKPYLQDGNNFYLLGKKEISTILYDLNQHVKSDKILFGNLKACVETLL